MSGPLEGVRVLDLSQIVSGPFAAMMLADLGADVIKVEPIGGGDPIRMGAFSRGGIAAMYLNTNRGKKAMSVNTQTERGREVVLDLMARSDVVIQNMRPGVVDRIGIGYAQCRQRNPKAIYCSISGYGSAGPWAHRPVLDPVIQGVTGIVARQQSEAIPIPDLVRMVIADKWTAQTAAQAIMAALFSRERTGSGQHLELSMLDATLYASWSDLMVDYTMIGDGVDGGLRVVDIYQLTDCSDAKLIYFGSSNTHIFGIMRALGRPELCSDPRFATRSETQKPENFAALGKIFAEEFLKTSRDEILARLVENDVPCGPVLEPEEVLRNEQIVFNGSLVEWDHPTAGRVRQPRHPVRFSLTPTDFGASCPVLGEHTDAILADLGRSDIEIDALRAAGDVA
jgi:crotonobetainyl-CoA:carnitine CoA-transferase CaiB-like acyl-CoA transferase